MWAVVIVREHGRRFELAFGHIVCGGVLFMGGVRRMWAASCLSWVGWSSVSCGYFLGGRYSSFVGAASLFAAGVSGGGGFVVSGPRAWATIRRVCALMGGGWSFVKGRLLVLGGSRVHPWGVAVCNL